MKLILILAGPYSVCISTENIWKEVCTKRDIELETYNLEEEQGENLARQYNLKSFPALIFDNKVIAVGHPSKEDATKIIDNLA